MRAVCGPLNSSSQAVSGEDPGPLCGSSGRPRLEVCSKVPENDDSCCPAISCSTSAGDFDGSGSLALAGSEPASTPAAITAGTTAAGIQRNHLRVIVTALQHRSS